MQHETTDKARPQRGMAIDLLLALIGLAVVLAVASTIQITGLSWSQTERLEPAGTTDSVRTFLQRQLSEATQRYYVEPNGARLLSFGGEHRGLTFVAPAPTGSGQYGLSAYSLDLIAVPRGIGDRALALSQVSYRPDIARNAVAAAPRRVLLDDIETIALRYFGRPEAGEAASWHEEWISSRFLPQLVAVEITFPAGDPRRWQPLIIELKLAGQPGPGGQ